MSLTTNLEVDEKRFVLICDQDVVWTKITVREPKGMELANDIQNAKKEPFVDRLKAPQGWPLNQLHLEALAVEFEKARSVRKTLFGQR